MSTRQEDLDDDLDDFDDPDNIGENPNESKVLRNLRKQAKDGRQAAKERDELQVEVKTLREEKLIREAKLDGLNEAQQSAVLGSVKGDLTAESLKAASQVLGFTKPDPEDQQNDDGHQQMADAAASDAPGQHNGNPVLTAAEFNKWDMPRKQDFIKRQPEKFEALKRGETVRLG